MRISIAAIALLAFTSGIFAQPAAKTPEQMLPADGLIYYRYDGYEPHRKAYEKTALALAMKEGLSDFIDHAFEKLFEVYGAGLPRDNAKKGPAPEVDGFLDCIWKHGVAVSLELAPPKPGPTNAVDLFQLTMVFPNGAEKKNRDALETVFRLAAGAAEAQVEDAAYQGRRIRIASAAAVKAAWWAEGKHLVLTVGEEPVERAMRVIDGRRPNVTAAPWYPELATFKRYETDMRGHVNLEAVVDRLAVFGLDTPGLGNLKDHLARQLLLRHLGLTGLKDLTFHLGFDGKYQRSTVRLGVVEPGQRVGLLNLVSGPIVVAPDKLPPMPPDTDYVSTRHVDWGHVFEFIRTSYGMLAISKLFAGELPERFPDLDRMVGGDFRKDFLDQLDPTLVSYGAHSEGPFFLGQAFAIKVKDEAKVRKGPESIAKALADIDDRLRAEKRTYRGVQMHVLNHSYLPLTYTVHNGWLVFGLFPQPVQGFILRSGGKYRVWKAPPELDEVLAKERKENPGGKVLTASVSDPRPAVEIGLALLPALVQLANQSAGAKFFDVSKIPNAQSVNEWLFPNIRLCYDDGNALRWENHYSINEPDDFLLMYTGPLMGGIPFSFLPTPRAERAIAPQVQEQATVLCPAAAVEVDGAIELRLRVRGKVTRETEHQVVERHYKEVVNSRGKKYVPYTVTQKVMKMSTVDVEQLKTFTADGVKVRVTRKDGKTVDPKDLLKLLENETQVLLVTKGEIDAEQLRQLDDRTLIITIAPAPAPPPVPPFDSGVVNGK